jgi:tRNA(His) 5'-end guanylyltransferase
LDCSKNRWEGLSQVRFNNSDNPSDSHKLERFSDKYAFEKPNDRRGIDLMNAAAKAVLKELPDIVIAYGVSDEYR